MIAGRTLAGLHGAGNPPSASARHYACIFRNRFFAMLACALAANTFTVKSTLAEDGCPAVESGPREATARIILRNDPCAKYLDTKNSIVMMYLSGPVPDYKEAKRWVQAKLDQLAREGYSGPFTNDVNTPDKLNFAIRALHLQMANLDKNIVADDAAKRDIQATVIKQQEAAKAEAAETAAADAAAQKKFNDSIAQRKDTGDYVCRTDGARLGFVENVHNDKIRIRIHHHEAGDFSFANGSTPGRDYDTFTWVNYNEVGLCQSPD